MKDITTFYGTSALVDCISCEICYGKLINFPGTVWRSKHFHVHQDIEIGLPGFLIVTTMQHVQSIQMLDKESRVDFVETVANVRRAQSLLGFEQVMLFQNEDTSDHFHLWMFPIHPWMKKNGRGLALLSASMKMLKEKNVCYEPDEVFEVVKRLQEVFGELQSA